MAWFRRRPRIDLGTFVPPPPAPEVPIDDLVDEGVLIAGAGVRLAVKNLIILRTLRDHANYDDEWMIQAVRHELLTMADEKDRDADRLAELAESVADREGTPSHHDDYRAVDARALARREEVSRALATRLRALSADDRYVRELVDVARDQAWDEIAASVKSRAREANRPVDEKYAEYRDDRLLKLLGDLADLDAKANSY